MNAYVPFVLAVPEGFTALTNGTILDQFGDAVAVYLPAVKVLQPEAIMDAPMPAIVKPAMKAKVVKRKVGNAGKCIYRDKDGKPFALPNFKPFSGRTPLVQDRPGTIDDRNRDRLDGYMQWHREKYPHLYECVRTFKEVHAPYAAEHIRKGKEAIEIRHDATGMDWKDRVVEAVTFINVGYATWQTKRIERTKLSNGKYTTRTRWDRNETEAEYAVTILLPGYFTKPWRANYATAVR